MSGPSDLFPSDLYSVAEEIRRPTGRTRRVRLKDLGVLALELARQVHLARAAAAAAILLEACALDRIGEAREAAAAYRMERAGFRRFAQKLRLWGLEDDGRFPGRYTLYRADVIAARMGHVDLEDPSTPEEIAEEYRVMVEGWLSAALDFPDEQD